ncbi:MAG: rhodanese-like domain-containing protein [Gammaproteobacteria bacterium]
MKTALNFLFLFLSFFLLVACSSPDEEMKAAGIQSINAVDASKKFTSEEAIIIDVREKYEWDEQHIPGAIFIPVAQLGTRLAEINQYKDRPVIMQCHSGRRSAQAAVLLHGAGFKEVYNLSGGILAWKQAGLDLEKKK